MAGAMTVVRAMRMLAVGASTATVPLVTGSGARTNHEEDGDEEETTAVGGGHGRFAE